MWGFSSPVLWNGLVRFILFWMVVGSVGYGLTGVVPYFNLGIINSEIRRALTGDFVGLSDPNFAYALAASLFTFALGLAVAFTLLHGFMIPAAIWSTKKHVKRSRDRAAFAANYETLHTRLAHHPIIGHAWKEFDETLVKRDNEPVILRNTVRPQTFLNFGVARERLFGLKMMGSIPSYFVGVGLLLTFIGLVLALNEASTAANSQTEGAMQAATGRLLNVATFKFSTSIAGLGASILLSLLFRVLTIRIEGSFDTLCQVIEARLLYTPPQSITYEMNEALAGQLAELKQINSADFFARMGEQIAPKVEAAFSMAFAPVTSSIDTAISRLADNSQSGVAEMIEQFRAGMEGSAGTELQALANALHSTHDVLVQTQQGILGSGEDFGRRLVEAAETLGRLVTDAGASLDHASEANRAALNDIVSAMRETFERANRKVEAEIDQTTSDLARGIGGEVERFSNAMRSIEAALKAQANAVEDATTQTQQAADGFRQTAEYVRHASTPLLQSGERIAGATERMSDVIAQSTAALEATQASCKELAASLLAHIDNLSTLWAGYAEKFENVDQELGHAISNIADSTVEQGQILSKFAMEVDKGLASAIDKLNPFLANLQENTEDFGENVAELRNALSGRAAAE